MQRSSLMQSTTFNALSGKVYNFEGATVATVIGVRLMESNSNLFSKYWKF